MEKTQPQEKLQWQGSVEARLPSTPAAAAWPHIASFCALHRYLPGVDVCERVAGEDGRPGCVRYVSSRPVPRPGEEDYVAWWAREELLEHDDAARRISYAIVANNIGFGLYVATMTVLEEPEPAGGCRLVWEFECEPVEGKTRDGLVSFLQAAVQGIAERIEEAVAAVIEGGGAAAVSARLLA